MGSEMCIRDRMSGLRWSDTIDGSSQATVLQRYFGMLTLAVFVTSGGYRLLIGFLLDSFAPVSYTHLTLPTILLV